MQSIKGRYRLAFYFFADSLKLFFLLSGRWHHTIKYWGGYLFHLLPKPLWAKGWRLMKTCLVCRSLVAWETKRQPVPLHSTTTFQGWCGGSSRYHQPAKCEDRLCLKRFLCLQFFLGVVVLNSYDDSYECLCYFIRCVDVSLVFNSAIH